MWNILVVDDDFGTRKLYNRILRKKAYLDHAVNGREALEAYQLSVSHGEPYDVILLDLVMPDMEGTSVLREIRRREQARSIQSMDAVPVIVISGRRDLIAEAVDCTDFLLKPVSPSSLLTSIRGLIASP